MKPLFQNNYLSLLCLGLQFCVLLFLFFYFFSCAPEEEDKPDCDSINRDFENILNKYRSCSSDADCIVIHTGSECVGGCHIGLNRSLQDAFEEELRQLSKQCVHINQTDRCGPETCTLIRHPPRCYSGICKSYL